MTIENNAGFTASTVYACHGAQHDMVMKPADDSLWTNHRVAYYVADDAPAAPIDIEPGREVFQELSSAGAAFSFNCPAEGANSVFNFLLRSEYSAPPFPVTINLGHHHCAIERSTAPISAPLVGQKITAAITIHSVYTKARAEGIEVKWTVGNEEQTVLTNADGRSEVLYEVKDEGEHSMQATFVNLYNGEPVTQTFPFRAFLTSPWEGVELTLNDGVVKFADLMVFKRGVNELTLKGPAQIRDLRIELHDAADLVIDAEPPFGSPLTEENGTFRCTITTGSDLSGRGMLEFRSDDVELPSERPFVVISKVLADEVEKVQVDGKDYAGPLWFFRDQPQTIEVVARSGSPLSSIHLDIEATPLTGLQVGDVKIEKTATNTSTVMVLNRSGTFDLDLTFGGLVGFEPVNLSDNKAMSTNLSDEVKEIRLAGAAYPPNKTYFRGQSETLTLIYQPNSPVADYPLTFKVTPLAGLQSGDVVITPTAAPHTWGIVGANRSGTFKFELEGDGFVSGIESAVNKLMSKLMDDEVDILVDGLPAIPNMPFFWGKQRVFSLQPKANSPIIGHEVNAELTFFNPLIPADVLVTRAGDPATSLLWHVTGLSNVGKFYLSFKGEGMYGSADLLSNEVMPAKLDDWMEVRLNGVYPENGFIAQARMQFELSLHPKGNLPTTPVSLQFESGMDITKQDFEISPAFDQNAPLLKWQLSANIDSAAQCTLLFKPALEGVTPIPLLLGVEPLAMSFDGKSVLPGNTVNALWGDTYKFTIEAKDTFHKGSKVKVELSDPSAGTVAPGAWVQMSPQAEFEFTANAKDTLFQLKVIFENSPTKPVIVNVDLKRGEPGISTITQDPARFIEGENNYFSMLVTSGDGVNAPLPDVEVGYIILGVPLNLGQTDIDGILKALSPMNLPGSYVLKAYARNSKGEVVPHVDFPYVVYAKSLE